VQAERTTHLIGSRYLPLDHWAYDYLNVLVSRGTLSGLQIFVQPWVRMDIARSVADAEREGRLEGEAPGWLERLEVEFAPELRQLEADAPQKIRLGAEFGAGVKGMSHTHRDVLRPGGDDAAFGLFEIEFVAEAPVLASDFRMRWDNHLLNDPQFPNGEVVEFRECDPIVERCAYRIEEAYVELQVPYVRMFLGRMYRNWGAPGAMGLLVSPYNYSYDHLGYRLGNAKISLSGVVALPNDFGGDTARYFSSHRLDWQIRDNLVVSVSESVIWGGPDARMELAYVNPVGIWEIMASKGSVQRNAMGAAEVWWRPFRPVAVYGGLLIDNTMVNDPGRAQGLTQWGVEFGVQLPGISRTLALRADMTIINSLAYRSRIDFYEYYVKDNIGLAHDKTDVILVHTQADWFGPFGLILKPKLDFMWKGEANITDAWPDDAFTGYDLLLVGTVEKSVRPALAGRWNLGWGSKRQWTVDAIWDLGVNIVKNNDHVASGWDAEFVGKIGGEVRFSLLR
jgi:hypothetical protein